HFLVDAGCTNIQRTAEDEWEAQYVVNLVGVVGATGRHDHVRTGSMGQLRADFRIRVGAGKDDGVFSHQLELRRLQQIRTGQADEYVSTLDRIGQGALVGFVGEDGLVFVQVITTGMDHALAINHADIFNSSTQTDEQLHAGHCGGAGTQADDLGVFQFLVCQLQSVEHGCCSNNGSTVLIIVKNRNIALLDERTLDLKALRSLDILKVDTAEGAGDALDCIDEGLGTFRLDFDVEYVNAGKALEQYTLAFHYRLGSQRAEVAQAENGSTIRDHRYQVALAGVFECQINRKSTRLNSSH